jgi:hypothetical protein
MLYISIGEQHLLTTQRWYGMSGARMISALAVTVFICACTGDGVDRDSFTTRDSAGIRIVENAAPAGDGGDAWHLGEQPLLDVGGLEGDPDYELYRVSNALRLPDGRIVIGNSGTNEIRFYDESGVHLLDAGGEGDGPGEFRFISWVSLYRGDSLVVYDRRQMRISVFDSAGRFARTFPVPGMDASGRGQAHGVFADGSLFVVAMSFTGPDGEDEAFRQEEPLYAVSPEGEFADSLGASPGSERFIHSAGNSSAGNSMVFIGSPMFGRSTEYGIHGHRFYVASNDTYEVRVHGRDGGLQSIVRRQHDHLEVTDADIEALREEQLGGDTPEGMREAMIDVLDATPIRETMPAYRGIMLDQIGNLWVEEYRRPGDTTPRWTVFSAEGEMLATMSLPERFVIRDAGDDYVLGTWRDELEIEHVRLYELMKP